MFLSNDKKHYTDIYFPVVVLPDEGGDVSRFEQSLVDRGQALRRISTNRNGCAGIVNDPFFHARWPPGVNRARVSAGSSWNARTNCSVRVEPNRRAPAWRYCSTS